MNDKNRITWLALLLLTTLSYFSSESSLPGPWIFVSLLGITAVKFTGVGFQFMDLKRAHPFWQISFMLLFCLYLLLCISLNQQV